VNCFFSTMPMETRSLSCSMYSLIGWLDRKTAEGRGGCSAGC
jgi:hypothetical protein